MNTFMQPHSPEIEKYIIGALIMSKSEEIYQIQEHDFYLQTMQQMYRVIKWLKDNNKQVDFLTVCEWAKKKYDDAYEVATECMNLVSTDAYFKMNLTRLKMYSTKRQILKKCSELQELVYDSEHENPEELKDDALDILGNIETPEGDLKLISYKDLMHKTLDKIETEYNQDDSSRLCYGFEKLDNLTGGFYEQELTIIGARPAVGKTAFTINLMLNVAKRSKALFVSREMSDIQIGKRFMSNKTSINGNKLRQPKSLNDADWGKIAQSFKELEDMRGDIYIDDTSVTVQQIRAQVRKLKQKKSIDILFVDYLTLVKSSKKAESRRLEIEDVSWSFKQIAKEFDIPVVVLAQLSRAATDKNEPPELHHLKECGAIEQDADNVIMLHIPTEQPSTDYELTEVWIRKQRNGPTGVIKLKNYKSNFKYHNN